MLTDTMAAIEPGTAYDHVVVRAGVARDGTGAQPRGLACHEAMNRPLPQGQYYSYFDVLMRARAVRRRPSCRTAALR